MQGVGSRDCVARLAVGIGGAGYTRNLDDGRVEVYASGKAAQLSQLEGYLWNGPAFSDVRGVEAREAAVVKYKDFQINR